MKLTSVLFVLTVLLILATIDSVQGRKSSRGGSGKKSKSRHDFQTCHLKEIDSCLDKIQALAQAPNPSSIITTSAGLDKLCGTVNDILKCVKGYLKKCGTPLQREIYELTIEYFTRTVKKFCDETPERESKFCCKQESFVTNLSIFE